MIESEISNYEPHQLSEMQGGNTEKYFESYRVPLDKNHDLIQLSIDNEKDDDFGIKLVIQDKQTDNEIIDLANLLDQKVRFESDPRMDMGGFLGTPVYSVNVEKRIIRMPSGNVFEDPKILFTLLHELGHLKTTDSMDEEQRKKLIETRVEFNQEPTPKTSQVILDEERKAWTNAIALARQIKNKFDINLFNLFDNLDDFQVWMRLSGLSSYESAAISQGVLKDFTKIKQIREHLDRDAVEMKKS